MHYFIAFIKKIPIRRNLTTFNPSSLINGKTNVRIYLAKFNRLTQKYPITRGMLTYSIIWPISNLCQQTISGRKELDFAEAFRFCLYGSCFVAPTLYAWLRIAANMWPGPGLKATLAKVSCQEISNILFLSSRIRLPHFLPEIQGRLSQYDIITMTIFAIIIISAFFRGYAYPLNILQTS